jgi:hypothetical protein
MKQVWPAAILVAEHFAANEISSSSLLSSRCTAAAATAVQGGIGAMELVAMELKGAGCYLSRSLSWAVSVRAFVLSMLTD